MSCVFWIIVAWNCESFSSSKEHIHLISPVKWNSANEKTIWSAPQTLSVHKNHKWHSNHLGHVIQSHVLSSLKKQKNNFPCIFAAKHTRNLWAAVLFSIVHAVLYLTCDSTDVDLINTGSKLASLLPRFSHPASCSAFLTWLLCRRTWMQPYFAKYKVKKLLPAGYGSTILQFI